MTNYIDQYKQIHSETTWFGSGACIYLEELSLIIDYLKPKSVLDYGCGKGCLVDALKTLYPEIEFYKYDPAIEEIKVLPVKKVDLVINTDVLEHIPEEYLEDVVKEIASLSENAFFALHHALACTILPNGENAHCTVKPPIWYYNMFTKFYKTPYPLKGRKVELSAMITFTPSIDFLQKYENIMTPKVIENLNNKPQKDSYAKLLWQKHINNLEEKRLLKVLENNKDKKFIFWGASIFLTNFLEKYSIDNEIYIVDKDVIKHTQKIMNHKIYPIDKISELNPDLVICSIKNNHKRIYPLIKQELKTNYPNIKLYKDLFY